MLSYDWNLTNFRNLICYIFWIFIIFRRTSIWQKMPKKHKNQFYSHLVSKFIHFIVHILGLHIYSWWSRYTLDEVPLMLSSFSRRLEKPADLGRFGIAGRYSSSLTSTRPLSWDEGRTLNFSWTQAGARATYEFELFSEPSHQNNPSEKKGRKTEKLASEILRWTEMVDF